MALKPSDNQQLVEERKLTVHSGRRKESDASAPTRKAEQC